MAPSRPIIAGPQIRMPMMLRIIVVLSARKLLDDNDEEDTIIIIDITLTMNPVMMEKIVDALTKEPTSMRVNRN